jgi:hypothetical protein
MLYFKSLKKVEMNQFLILVFVYFFVSYSSYSQTHQHFQSDSTSAVGLNDDVTYLTTHIDDNGLLRIETSNSEEIIFEKDSAQVDFDNIRISDNGNAVGWLQLYKNSSTSYPIPLELKIYSGGQIHIFTGCGLPIWLWNFTAGGKQVYFKQETVHGDFGIHYELREVFTGQLIDDFNPKYGPDNQPLKIQGNVPMWVEELDDSK